MRVYIHVSKLAKSRALIRLGLPLNPHENQAVGHKRMEQTSQEECSYLPGLKGRSSDDGPTLDFGVHRTCIFSLSDLDCKLWLPPPRDSPHLKLDLNYQHIFIKEALKKNYTKRNISRSLFPQPQLPISFHSLHGHCSNVLLKL